MKKYRIIDSHCHIYPDKIAEKASASTSDFYKMPSLFDGKISTLLDKGTEAGIEHFIVQSVATTPKQVSGINHFIAEEEADMPPVWDAYKTLKERDKVILRLLVIEEKDVMDAAHEIWPYINSPYRIHEVTQKHIQSTIAMAKHRALLALMNSMNKTVKN